MNPFKTVAGIVLGVLGKKEFTTNEEGHLVLTPEEAELLNARMKYREGKFAEAFKASFDELADANASGDHSHDELIMNALADAIRKDLYGEVKEEFVTRLEQTEEALRRAHQEAEQAKLAAEQAKQEAEQAKQEAEQAETVQEELETAKQLKLAAEQAKLVTEQRLAEVENEKKRLEGENAILAAKTEEVNVETVAIKAGEEAHVATKVPFKVNRDHYHNKMAFEFLAGNTSKMIMAQANPTFSNRQMGGGPSDTIDVSELNEEFGTYLSDQARKLTLYKDILKPTQSRQYMTKVLAINEWRDAQVRIDSVVQQFIAKWTPLGKVKVTPLVIPNRRHKINLPIVPDDITGGYLTYLYNEGLTPDQMPVTQYIIDQLLRPRIDQDIEYKMIASGQFEELDSAAITEGDAGQAPEKSMDGYLTIISKEYAKASTKMNFWTPTVEWSEDNSVEYFEAYAKWIKSVNPTLAVAGMNVFCDPDMDETRQKKYREMFPMTKNVDMDNMKIDFSNLTIVPLENMRGTGTIFATPKVNFIELHHINEAAGATKLFLQLSNYEVRVFGEFWLGVGFAVSEWVFAAIGASASGSGA